ncbi:MAG: hypothetical protein P1T08_18950, partial [Acidimicrobiia bacterium]|nr:hypothetical protein [Acidimicrobiia bacterium]
MPLDRALADLERPRRSLTDPEPASVAGITDRVGRGAVRMFEATGLVDLGGLQHRLRAIDKPIETHAYQKLLGGIAGLVVPVIFGLAMAPSGVHVAPGWTAALAVGFGLGGFMWPDLGLSEQIERRRRDFRHSLSAYLDLVTIILAGGGGLETALQT